MQTNTPIGELPALFEELREAAKADARQPDESRMAVNLIDVAEIYLQTQLRIAEALERLASTVRGPE